MGMDSMLQPEPTCSLVVQLKRGSLHARHELHSSGVKPRPVVGEDAFVLLSHDVSALFFAVSEVVLRWPGLCPSGAP
jgi:hypothetical protein